MDFSFSTSIYYRFEGEEDFEQLTAFIIHNMGLYFAYVQGFQNVLQSDTPQGLKNEIEKAINPDARPMKVMYQTANRSTLDDILGFWDNLKD